ncbi:uncharacterized protein LOC133729183 isoform X2 [Rosa rugosa]|uniref:uncharacterized protein LOC133729183 isoform X2 n=2 Tax=Rosa rugosa TaxID=74645 RepID=UPI002B416FDE|nr:uncharacterized protein LOC133729183 isoform X2 [Rosa rugosa]
MINGCSWIELQPLTSRNGCSWIELQPLTSRKHQLATIWLERKDSLAGLQDYEFWHVMYKYNSMHLKWLAVYIYRGSKTTKYDHVLFGDCHTIFTTYYASVRGVLSSQLMGFGMVLRTSSNGANSEEIIDQLQ